MKIDFKNINKKNLIIIGLALLVLIVIIASFIVGKSLGNGNDKKSSKNSKEKKELLEFTDKDYEYKLTINAYLKKNKIKEYNITITKAGEKVLSQTVKRQDKKETYEVNIRKMVLEKGFGSYNVVMNYKSGLFKKEAKLTFIVDDVPGVKNVKVNEDYANQIYTVTVDKVKDSIGYRAVVSKDDQVKNAEIKDLPDAETYDIDISEIVKELGVGKYNLQVENLISEQLTGMPKFTTFIVKQVVPKPALKITTNDAGHKILNITKEENINSLKVDVYKNGTYFLSITDTKNAIDLTQKLREKNAEEGTYKIKVIPEVSNNEYYIVDTVNEKSIAVASVDITYDKVNVSAIGGADLPVINRPWIAIGDIDSAKYRYFVDVKSSSVSVLYEYNAENSNVVMYDDVRLAGGRYFLSKDQVEKIALGDTVTLTIYKEDKATKEKSYEVTYKMEKKKIESGVIKVDSLQVIN